MAKYNLVIFLFPYLLIFSSCGFKEPIFEVLDGNYSFLSGDYTGATISYIKALEKENHTEWIYYNIGNVYNALGETNPAIEKLVLATKGANRELIFRSHYNLGNTYFRLGKYKDAVFHFKTSLKAKQNDIDAKINLELAIEKMEKEETLENEILEKNEVKTKVKAKDLLDYTKQKESVIWKRLIEMDIEEQEDDW